MVSLLLGAKKDKAKKLYQDFRKKGINVLFDDRIDKSSGEKLVEADLIGIPYRVIISEKTLAKNCVEVKKRNEKKVKLVKIREIRKWFMENRK